MNIHPNLAMLNALNNAKRRSTWRKLRRAKNLIGGIAEIHIYTSANKKLFIRSQIKDITWTAGKPTQFQLRRSKLFRGGRRGHWKGQNILFKELGIRFETNRTGVTWITFENTHYVFSVRGITKHGVFSSWVYIYPSTEKDKVPKRPNF